MVASEIQSLTEQIKDLEEKFKVITVLPLKYLYLPFLFQFPDSSCVYFNAFLGDLC